MNNNIYKRVTGIFAAALLAGSVAACSGGEQKESEADTEALPPVIAEVSDLDGATFEINDEQPLVVNAPDPTEWDGSTEDPAVAEFFPGEDDGSALFNPGFEARGSGSTGASMTSPDGETYDFTIMVR